MNEVFQADRERFDTAIALTEDRLHSLVPSIFSVDAHESRSERFVPIPTIEVVRGLAKEGFSVVSAKQKRVKLMDRANYTQHALRFRQLDRDYQVNGTVFEMLMTNANDGTSRYHLLAALYRILCMNSAVAALGDVGEIQVTHAGKNTVNKVIEGTYAITKTAQLALAAPQDWSQIQLDNDERMAFAESAHSLRFADVETPIKPAALLTTHRADDEGHDLWSTFNVVQENVIKGGLHGVGANANNVVRRVTTRPITSINKDTQLNKALWMLGERMKELKQAA